MVAGLKSTLATEWAFWTNFDFSGQINLIGLAPGQRNAAKIFFNPKKSWGKSCINSIRNVLPQTSSLWASIFPFFSVSSLLKLKKYFFYLSKKQFLSFIYFISISYNLILFLSPFVTFLLILSILNLLNFFFSVSILVLVFLSVILHDKKIILSVKKKM